MSKNKAEPQTKNAESLSKKARGPESTKECAICVHELPAEQFIGKITANCTHVRDVCRECVARTINLEVNGKGNSTRILCPHKGCNSELEHSDVQREATPAVFERFDQLLLRKMLQGEPGFRWCANPSCASGQIVEDFNPSNSGWNTFLRCHHCQHRTCVYHRCSWHTERTCKQYEADGRNSDEVGLLQYFEREGVKRCPNCGHAIEKNGGCDHMTCNRQAGGCGSEFCIRCLADYNGPNGIRTRGNSAHKPSCPWYFPDPNEQGDDDDYGEDEDEEEEEEEVGDENAEGLHLDVVINVDDSDSNSSS